MAQVQRAAGQQQLLPQEQAAKEEKKRQEQQPLPVRLGQEDIDEIMAKMLQEEDAALGRGQQNAQARQQQVALHVRPQDVQVMVNIGLRLEDRMKAQNKLREQKEAFIKEVAAEEQKQNGTSLPVTLSPVFNQKVFAAQSIVKVHPNTIAKYYAEHNLGEPEYFRDQDVSNASVIIEEKGKKLAEDKKHGAPVPEIKELKEAKEREEKLKIGEEAKKETTDKAVSLSERLNHFVATNKNFVVQFEKIIDGYKAFFKTNGLKEETDGSLFAALEQFKKRYLEDYYTDARKDLYHSGKILLEKIFMYLLTNNKVDVGTKIAVLRHFFEDVAGYSNLCSFGLLDRLDKVSTRLGATDLLSNLYLVIMGKLNELGSQFLAFAKAFDLQRPDLTPNNAVLLNDRKSTANDVHLLSRFTASVFPSVNVMDAMAHVAISPLPNDLSLFQKVACLRLGLSEIIMKHLVPEFMAKFDIIMKTYEAGKATTNNMRQQLEKQQKEAKNQHDEQLKKINEKIKEAISTHDNEEKKFSQQRQDIEQKYAEKLKQLQEREQTIKDQNAFALKPFMERIILLKYKKNKALGTVPPPSQEKIEEIEETYKKGLEKIQAMVEFQTAKAECNKRTKAITDDIQEANEAHNALLQKLEQDKQSMLKELGEEKQKLELAKESLNKTHEEQEARFKKEFDEIENDFRPIFNNAVFSLNSIAEEYGLQLKAHEGLVRMQESPPQIIRRPAIEEQIPLLLIDALIVKQVLLLSPQEQQYWHALYDIVGRENFSQILQFYTRTTLLDANARIHDLAIFVGKIIEKDRTNSNHYYSPHKTIKVLEQCIAMLHNRSESIDPQKQREELVQISIWHGMIGRCYFDQSNLVKAEVHFAAATKLARQAHSESVSLYLRSALESVHSRPEFIRSFFIACENDFKREKTQFENRLIEQQQAVEQCGKEVEEATVRFRQFEARLKDYQDKRAVAAQRCQKETEEATAKLKQCEENLKKLQAEAKEGQEDRGQQYRRDRDEAAAKLKQYEEDLKLYQASSTTEDGFKKYLDDARVLLERKRAEHTTKEKELKDFYGKGLEYLRNASLQFYDIKLDEKAVFIDNGRIKTGADFEDQLNLAIMRHLVEQRVVNNVPLEFLPEIQAVHRITAISYDFLLFGCYPKHNITDKNQRIRAVAQQLFEWYDSNNESPQQLTTGVETVVKLMRALLSPLTTQDHKTIANYYATCASEHEEDNNMNAYHELSQKSLAALEAVSDSDRDVSYWRNLADTCEKFAKGFIRNQRRYPQILGLYNKALSVRTERLKYAAKTANDWQKEADLYMQTAKLYTKLDQYSESNQRCQQAMKVHLNVLPDLNAKKLFIAKCNLIIAANHIHMFNNEGHGDLEAAFNSCKMVLDNCLEVLPFTLECVTMILKATDLMAGLGQQKMGIEGAQAVVKIYSAIFESINKKHTSGWASDSKDDTEFSGILSHMALFYMNIATTTLKANKETLNTMDGEERNQNLSVIFSWFNEAANIYSKQGRSDAEIATYEHTRKLLRENCAPPPPSLLLDSLKRQEAAKAKAAKMQVHGVDGKDSSRVAIQSSGSTDVTIPPSMSFKRN